VNRLKDPCFLLLAASYCLTCSCSKEIPVEQHEPESEVVSERTPVELADRFSDRDGMGTLPQLLSRSTGELGAVRSLWEGGLLGRVSIEFVIHRDGTVTKCTVTEPKKAVGDSAELNPYLSALCDAVEERRYTPNRIEVVANESFGPPNLR